MRHVDSLTNVFPELEQRPLFSVPAGSSRASTAWCLRSGCLPFVLAAKQVAIARINGPEPSDDANEGSKAVRRAGGQAGEGLEGDWPDRVTARLSRLFRL